MSGNFFSLLIIHEHAHQVWPREFHLQHVKISKEKPRIDVSQKTLGYNGYQLQLQTDSGKQPVEQAGSSSVLYI